MKDARKEIAKRRRKGETKYERTENDLTINHPKSYLKASVRTCAPCGIYERVGHTCSRIFLADKSVDISFQDFAPLTCVTAAACHRKGNDGIYYRLFHVTCRRMKTTLCGRITRPTAFECPILKCNIYLFSTNLLFLTPCVHHTRRRVSASSNNFSSYNSSSNFRQSNQLQ